MYLVELMEVIQNLPESERSNKTPRKKQTNAIEHYNEELKKEKESQERRKQEEEEERRREEEEEDSQQGYEKQLPRMEMVFGLRK